MNEQQVSLENLMQGGATELFQIELEKALNNCMDVNTDAKRFRTITLKLKIKPDDKRKSVDAILSCESTLAPNTGEKTTLYIGKDQGKPVAVEYDPAQGNLFNQDEMAEKRSAANA